MLIVKEDGRAPDYFDDNNYSINWWYDNGLHHTTGHRAKPRPWANLKIPCHGEGSKRWHGSNWNQMTGIDRA
jgi:hypothetical protein